MLESHFNKVTGLQILRTPNFKNISEPLFRKGLKLKEKNFLLCLPPITSGYAMNLSLKHCD